MKVKISMNPEVSKTFELSTLTSAFSTVKVERSEDGCELIMGPNGTALRALKESLKQTSGIGSDNDDEKFGTVTTYLYMVDLHVLLSHLMKELPLIYMLSKLMEMFETEAEAIEFMNKTVKTRMTNGDV